MKTYRETIQELKSLIVDAINDGRLDDVELCDLHHEVFNTDYYIIGRYDSEQWLINNGGIFNAINVIKNYEEDNFGTITTDFSEPERICNMYVYILGEEVVFNLNTVQNNFGKRLNDELLVELLEELNH
jgi:hypothetical protein